MFKIKDGYKLELQMPEIMKLFGSSKKLILKTKNGENALILEVVGEFIVQCNLVGNQYQQKSQVLYTFMLDKSYLYLPVKYWTNLVFLKTFHPEFDETIITFTGKNGRPLEMEDKINLTLLINK